MDPFKHENVIKLAGVLGVALELRTTANGNSVATVIVYTNYIPRNMDGSTRQESEWHRVMVWGLHAEKAARLLTKGSKIRAQGRMSYPTWKDRTTGETATARRSSPRRSTIRARMTRPRSRLSRSLLRRRPSSSAGAPRRPRPLRPKDRRRVGTR